MVVGVGVGVGLGVVVVGNIRAVVSARAVDDSGGQWRGRTSAQETATSLVITAPPSARVSAAISRVLARVD